MSQLKIGDPVQLTTKQGDVATTRVALVFGIYYLFGLTGVEGEPLIDTISPNLKQMALAGGVDWVGAVERNVGVRHSSHEDIGTGKIGVYYDEFNGPFPADPAAPDDTIVGTGQTDTEDTSIADTPATDDTNASENQQENVASGKKAK